jgi:hypothetical protein
VIKNKFSPREEEVLALADALRGKRVYTKHLRAFDDLVPVPEDAVVTITGRAEDCLTDRRYLDVVADVRLDDHPQHPHEDRPAWVWTDVLTYDRTTGQVQWHVNEVV